MAKRTFHWLGNLREMSHLDVPDLEVARRVRMLMRDDLNHESVCTMARDRIMTLFEEKEALRNPWQSIPANEKIPSTEPVLVRRLNPRGKYAVDMAFLTVSGQWVASISTPISGYSHWMPIPE